MREESSLYYNLAPGWMVRQEWAEYLAFNNKTRSIIRLNGTAYDIFHSLMGRSMDEAMRFLAAKKYSIRDKEAGWIAETASVLINQKLLVKSRVRITPSSKDLGFVTVANIIKFADDPAVTGRAYYQTPASVLWSVTNRCNFRCKYCAPESSAADNSDIGLDALIKIQKELSEHRVFEVIITGGEALLRRKETFNLLEKLRSSGHFIHLLSNGMLMDDDAMEKLGHLKVGVGVSLDGPTDEINGTSRVRGTFKRVTDSLGRMVKKGIWTNVLTVLTRFNIDALDAHFEMLDAIGVKYLVLQPLRPSGRARKIFESFRPTEYQLKKLPENLDQIKKRFPNINVDDYEVRMWGDLLRLADLPNREPRKVLSCGAGVRFCVIGADGGIFPCNALLDIGCGNLLSRSLLDIWHNSLPLRELRVLSGKSVGVISPCSGCRLNVLCDGGCRADAFHHTGSWIGLHPFCLSHLDARSGSAESTNSKKSPVKLKPSIKDETLNHGLGSIISH